MFYPLPEFNSGSDILLIYKQRITLIKRICVKKICVLFKCMVMIIKSQAGSMSYTNL